MPPDASTRNSGDIQAREAWARAVDAQRTANAALSRELEDALLWIGSVWFVRGDERLPYNIEGFEFLEEIVQCKDRYVAVMAGSGVGKTEIFLPYGLAYADWGKRVLYCFESGKKTSHLVQERVNPNFKSNPYLAKRNRGEVDNIELKRLGRGYVYYLGMGTDSVTRSYHGDVLILDESDAMDKRRKADMVKRLTTAGSPIIRELSNPSLPGVGIHKAFMDGDRSKWHVHCPKCKLWEPLHFNTHVDKASCTIRCPHCKTKVERRTGRWIPTNPGAPHRSFHIHRLMAAICDLPQMVKDSESEDEDVRSAFVRMDLGEPYAERTGGLTQEDLAGCDGGPEWTQYAPGGFLTCDPGGVYDVQIWKAVIPGTVPRCVWVGSVRDFDELAQLVEASHVSSGLIDWGPEQKAAEAFCRNQYNRGRDFRRVAYRLPDAAGNPDWLHDPKDRFLIVANRTGALDGMVKKIRDKKMLFPSRVVQNSESRFSKHMKAPSRVIETDSHGLPVVKWVHDATNRDDQFHCSVYASIQLERLETAQEENFGVAQEGD